MHQGNELKKFRKQRKIKITKIADAMGFKKNSIYFIEKRELIQLDTLKKYCKAINLPITYFYPDIKEEESIQVDAIGETQGKYGTEFHMGNQIKQLREAKHVKVTDFAKALGYTNRQSVYSMEKRKSVDLETIKKAAEYLEISIEKLINVDALNTFEIQPRTSRDLENELVTANKKIIELQEKIIQLQEENMRLRSDLSR